MTMFIRSVERAYPWLLGLPVILPVIVWGGFIYPYLVPKTLLFYTISFVALAAFLLLATHGRAFFWGRLAQKATWIPAALLALAYVASAYGLDFYRSFWSMFVRGDGLLMLTCAVTSFYLILLSADRRFFERLLRSVAVVGTFVALYGISEALTSGGRIGSLLGNAAFFAGYLGIAFFATLIAAISLTRGWRRAAYAGALLQIIAIMFTATRGTMLALVTAGVGYVAFSAYMKEGKQRAWSAGILVALMLFGGLFFAFRGELAHSPFAPIARIASIGQGDADVASRLFIWKNMVGEIQKSPWLGVGAEHIDVLFNRFYDPTLISEQWFDRSHNAFLDYAAQYGLAGLLLYIALIGTFFAAGARIWSRGEKRDALLFTLLAVTYAVQNFFVFDTISSFWLLLALLALASAYADDSSTQKVLTLPAWTRVAVWPVALALVVCIIPVSVRPALAAYDLAQAYKYQLSDVSREASYLSRGSALLTYGDLEYGYEAYDMYANKQASVLTGQALTDAYQSALAILTTDFNRYTYDARTSLYLAHVLSLAPPGVAVDQALLTAALERTLRLSSRRYQPWYILVNLSISRANLNPPKSSERIAGYAAARDLLSRYIALVPTLSQPHYALAELDYASGDTAGAASEAAKGKMYYVGDSATARRAATYYENVLDLPNAAFFLAEVVRFDPTDSAAASDLKKIQSYEPR